MQIMNKIIFLLVIAIASSVANATSSKGMATITINDEKPSGEEVDSALLLAKYNAIERFIATQNNSKQRNFELISEEVKTTVDDYILGHIVLNETVESDRLRYSVVIRADLNVGKLENRLQDSSAVGSATSWEKSYLTFVFVAREQASIKSYDDKVVKRVDVQNQEVGRETESASGSNYQYNSNAKSSNKTTTGGSTTRKAEKVEFQVTSTSDINSVMTRVFTENNFEVVEAEFLEEETNYQLSLNDFRSDFSSGDDISGKTLRNAAKGIKSVEVPYIAVGSIDIGMQDTDPTTGLVRVFVTVSGKVISVESRFPKTIASVGPIQFAGTGPSKSVARTNALNLAAEKAAKNLADQLNAKGVK